MTANPYPFKAPYDDRDASALLGVEKLYNRKTLPDADAVRNGDWSDQFGGVFVKTTGSNYDIDTGDVSADDGVNVIIDGVGTHFVKVAVNTDLTQRVHTGAGAVTVDADDVDIIIVKKVSGAATAVNLPSASGRTKPVRIVDGKYDAATNNITINPDGSETIMGGASYIIDSNGASITLTPLADGTGWI